MNAGLDRTRHWLRCHRLDTEPSPLVGKRLRARRNAALAEAATLLVATAALVAWLAINKTDDTMSATNIGLVVIMVVGAIVGMGWKRWFERPLLASRVTRSAHPSAPDLVQILGRGPLAVAVALFGGGLVLGVALVTFAAPGAAWALALAFLVGVALLTGLAAVGLAAVVRRPALAEDHESLRVDDVMRAEDARRVVLPYPLVLVFYFGLSAATWIQVLLLVYAATGAVGWYLGERSVRCAANREPVAL
jgi:hypothetical protein